MSRETYCPGLEGTFCPGVLQGLLWQHLPTVGQLFATFGDFGGLWLLVGPQNGLVGPKMYSEAILRYYVVF